MASAPRSSSVPIGEAITELHNITKSFRDHSEPIIEVITRPNINRSRQASEISRSRSPIFRLNTSVNPAIVTSTSPTYESSSQRRRRERQKSHLDQVILAPNIIYDSAVSIDIIDNSGRPLSPDRRRDDDIDMIKESEHRCFKEHSFESKSVFPAHTPITPGHSSGMYFNQHDLSSELDARVNDWVGGEARIGGFESTPILPAPEMWEW